MLQSLIVGKEKLGMESPKPERIGRRKELLALEYAATGGYPHFGHLPVYVQEIEGWTFRRCRFGFTLALTPSGTILWLKITKPAVEIKNFKLLLRALNSNCLVHPRPEPLKVAGTPVEASPDTPVEAIADIGTKASEPVVSKKATSTLSQQASSKTQNESKPTSKQATPGMLRLEKPQPIEQRVDRPPPVKQRRVYVPDTTTGRTRERQRPFGR
jgi:hypothetical protein